MAAKGRWWGGGGGWLRFLGSGLVAWPCSAGRSHTHGCGSDRPWARVLPVDGPGWDSPGLEQPTHVAVLVHVERKKKSVGENWCSSSPCASLREGFTK